MSKQIFPLSASQQTIFSHCQMSTTKSAYHIPILLEISNACNAGILASSINDMHQYHPMITLKISMIDGVPMNTVELYEFEVNHINVASYLELNHFTNEILQQPFTLIGGPLIRFYIICSADERKFLYIIYHHILTDELPQAFYSDLQALYNSRSSKITNENLTKLAAYQQFVEWESSYIVSEEAKRDKIYWEKKLNDLPSIGFPHLASNVGTTKRNFDYLKINLPMDLSERLHSKSKASHITNFAMYVSALFLLLKKYTGEDDLCIRTIVNRRYLKNFSKELGDFTNTVILRDKIKNNSVESLAKSIFRLIMDAIMHSKLPYNQIIQDKDININVSIVYHPKMDLLKDSLDFNKSYEICQVPHEKFNVEIIEDEQGALIFFKFDSGLYARDDIKRIASDYLYLLEVMASKNDMLLKDIALTSAQKPDFLVGLNNFNLDNNFRQSTLQQQFEMVAFSYPTLIAVDCEGETVTYHQLNERANQLARYIRSVSKDDNFFQQDCVVAILLPKGIEAIIAMLAVLKLGGAYLPIDINYPNERIKAMLSQSGVKFILDKEILNQGTWELISQYEGSNLDDRLATSNLAYIIYTSGTTGVPNGVAVNHTGLLNLAKQQGKCFGVKPNVRVLQFASLAFDASVSEIWVTLLNKGTLCIPASQEPLIGELLIDFINQQKINVATIPPSILSTISPGSFSLDTLVLAGESANYHLIESWLPYISQIINAYGPTEATVCATMHVYKPNDLATNIGRPLDNVLVYLLDSDGKLAPIGVNAELYIGGEGLASGYLYNDSLTSERFVANTIHPKCGLLYKTGDMARYLPNGDIEYRGRRDTQIKIRGFRVELGEIEHTINLQAGIINSVLLVDETEQEKKLVACIQCSNDLKLECLKAALSRALPRHMLPNHYFVVDTLPLTINGKHDKNKLLSEFHIATKHKSVTEITSSETLLDKFISLCADVLNVPQDEVILSKSFFQLGGTSLTILKFISRMQKQFAIPLSIKQVFESSNLAEIYESLKSKQACDDKFEKSMKQDLQFSFEHSSNLIHLMGAPVNIFLTGASGFIGSHLLRQLLKLTNAHIYCLVRPHTGIASINIDEYSSRVTYLEGNLAVDGFGLKSCQLEMLAETIDCILHCGAEVNHIYPYDMLRAANVQSTQQLIKLASSKRLKRIHYLSTIDTVTSLNSQFDSENNIATNCLVNWGYIQSKWVSEKILRQSSVPSSIYRLGNITGDSEQGISNPTKNHASLLLKTCIESGVTPDWDIAIEMTPVDKLSEAVIKLAMTNHHHDNLIYNLHNPESLSWDEYMDVIRACGYSVERQPYKQWKEQVLSVMPDNNPFFSFKSLYENDELNKLSLKPGMIKNITTKQALNEIGCTFDYDYYTLTSLYLDYFEKINFLPLRVR